MLRSRQGARRATVSPDAAPSTLVEGVWQLDPAHSRVAFEVPHYWGFGTVKGRFARYAGFLDLSSRPAIELTIDAGSVDTRNPRRDRHLRSPEFFSVDQHPYVRFVSDWARADDDRLAVHGELMARGRRIEVELEASVSARPDGFDLIASTFVMHRGLGITWNPFGITRPYSKLSVAGRLVAATSPPDDRRGSGPGRRAGRPGRAGWAGWAGWAAAVCPSPAGQAIERCPRR